MENLNFLRPHDLYIYFSSNVSNLKLPPILSSIRHSRRGENDQQFAGIVVGKAWMRSNEGCLEFNPLLSQEQSNPRAKTLFHLVLNSVPLSPRTNRESETSKRWRNIELVHLRQRNVISIEQRSTQAKDSRYLRKAPRLDPRPDSWKYMETCSIRLGYYRGLGHRTGFLESSAKCAPDWTDTKDVVPPGYAINPTDKLRCDHRARRIPQNSSPSKETLEHPSPRFPPADKPLLSLFLSFFSFSKTLCTSFSRCVQV